MKVSKNQIAHISRIYLTTNYWYDIFLSKIQKIPENPENIESGYKIRIRIPENFWSQFFLKSDFKGGLWSKICLKNESFYEFFIGPKLFVWISDRRLKKAQCWYMPMEWGIYGEHVGHSPQVEKGRAKKFYIINRTFFGLFRLYPSDFGFDTEFAVPKIAYFRQSNVLVSN